MKKHKNKRGDLKNNWFIKGRPEKYRNRTKRKILNGVQKNPFIAASSLKTEMDLECSPQTVRNIIKSKGYRAQKPAKKEGLSEIQKRRRLELCKERRNYPLDYWRNIDESRIYRNGSDCQNHV